MNKKHYQPTYQCGRDSQTKDPVHSLCSAYEKWSPYKWYKVGKPSTEITRSNMSSIDYVNDSVRDSILEHFDNQFDEREFY